MLRAEEGRGCERQSISLNTATEFKVLICNRKTNTEHLIIYFWKVELRVGIIHKGTYIIIL